MRLEDTKLDELLARAERAISFAYPACSWHQASDFTADGFDPEDADFIAACSPETIRALVQEVKQHREFVAAVRHHADSSPGGDCTQDYRDGYEAMGNWIRHHLRTHDNEEKTEWPRMTFNDLYSRLDTVLVKLPEPKSYEPFDWKPWKIVNPVERLPFIRSVFQVLTAKGKRWDAVVDMDIPELRGAGWDTRIINSLAEMRLDMAIMSLRDTLQEQSK